MSIAKAKLAAAKSEAHARTLAQKLAYRAGDSDMDRILANIAELVIRLAESRVATMPVREAKTLAGRDVDIIDLALAEHRREHWLEAEMVLAGLSEGQLPAEVI